MKLKQGNLTGTLTYEVMAGCHINHVVDEMIDLAKEHNTDVVADFNGSTLFVSPNSVPSKVLEDWNTEMNKKREEYIKSDAGRRIKEEQEKTRRKHQKRVDELQEELYRVVNTDKILDWCSELAEHGDYIGVWFDKPRILEKLERAGYEANAYVGTKPEEFSKYTFLMYIIGQVMDCLRNGMPPHPMTIRFVEEWKKKYS